MNNTLVIPVNPITAIIMIVVFPSFKSGFIATVLAVGVNVGALVGETSVTVTPVNVYMYK